MTVKRPPGDEERTIENPMSDTEAAKPVSDAADVARRLRGYNTYDSTKMRHNTPQVCLEAADTIERLAKIEKRAQEAFESWGDNEPTFVRNTLHYIWKGSVCIGWEGDLKALQPAMRVTMTDNATPLSDADYQERPRGIGFALVLIKKFHELSSGAVSGSFVFNERGRAWVDEAFAYAVSLEGDQSEGGNK